MSVEYRVKEIKRYVVTRFESSCAGTSCSEVGEYASGDTAYQVGYAMCRQEHINSGQPEESISFKYPSIPDGVSVNPN